MKRLVLLSLFCISCQRAPTYSCDGTYASWFMKPIKLETRLQNDEWNAAIISAISTWNMAYNHTVLILSSRGIPIEFSDKLNDGEQGRTSARYYNGYLLKASVKIKPLLYLDKESLLLHEFGHVLGLKHQPDSSTEFVMSPYLDPSQKRRDINMWALERVICLYGP